MMKKVLDFLKKTLFLQPFLLCGYILLINLDAFGVSEIIWYEPLFVFIISLIFWGLLFFFSRLFFKSNLKSASIASFVVFTSMMFTDFSHVLLVRDRYWILIITASFILLCFLLINYHRPKTIIREKVILFFNVVLILLNVQVLGRIVTKTHVKPTLFDEKQQITKTNGFQQDIYVIVLDGYASSKSLEKFWKFNDSNFINSLSNLGFYFAKNSKSNYCYTIQTMCSMLNLNYIKSDLEDEEGMLKNVKNNKLVNILHADGYEIYNFSLFDIGERTNPYKIDGFANIISFYNSILDRSVFKIVKSYFTIKESIGAKSLTDKKVRETAIADSLKLLINSKEVSPKFVLYHSMVTHYPYYLDRNGKENLVIEKQRANVEIPPWWIGSKTGFNTFGNAKEDSIWMDSYLNSVKYANESQLDLIKQILKNNQRPPTIIVMSDHGFRYLLNKPIQNVDFERYSNFCAIYYPDKNYQELYDSITPVNMMRNTLNKVTSTQFKHLPDYSGLSTNTSAKE